MSSRLQDINVVWDSPKYPQTMKLRAFYAVPKMVVIPSGSCLGKRKIQQVRRARAARESIPRPAPLRPRAS